MSALECLEKVRTTYVLPWSFPFLFSAVVALSCLFPVHLRGASFFVGWVVEA